MIIMELARARRARGCARSRARRTRTAGRRTAHKAPQPRPRDDPCEGARAHTGPTASLPAPPWHLHSAPPGNLCLSPRRRQDRGSAARQYRSAERNRTLATGYTMTSPRCLLHACLVLCTLVSSVVQAQVYCERRAGYCTYDSSCQCEDTHYDGRYRKMRWNADAGGHCWACECAAGYKYHSFSTLCVACPHGEYQPTDGARPSDCIDCPAGKYQGSEASASCKDCMAGTWNPDTRAIGYSSIYNNGVYCRSCDRGRASSRSGRSTNCPRCPTGKSPPRYEYPLFGILFSTGDSGI
jgi:hypothetical protein